MPHPAPHFPSPHPLDESVWTAWLAHGNAEERHRGQVRLKAVKWFSGAVLLATAMIWPLPDPYATIVRFTVSAGALVVMLRAFREGHHPSMIFFGALALLFNPILPVFVFAGEGPRSLIIASAIPFLASLGWRLGRLAPHA